MQLTIVLLMQKSSSSTTSGSNTITTTLTPPSLPESPVSGVRTAEEDFDEAFDNFLLSSTVEEENPMTNTNEPVIVNTQETIGQNNTTIVVPQEVPVVTTQNMENDIVANMVLTDEQRIVIETRIRTRIGQVNEDPITAVFNRIDQQQATLEAGAINRDAVTNDIIQRADGRINQHNEIARSTVTQAQMYRFYLAARTLAMDHPIIAGVGALASVVGSGIFAYRVYGRFSGNLSSGSASLVSSPQQHISVTVNSTPSTSLPATTPSLTLAPTNSPQLQPVPQGRLIAGLGNVIDALTPFGVAAIFGAASRFGGRGGSFSGSARHNSGSK